MSIFAALNTKPASVKKTYTAPDGTAYEVEFLPVYRRHEMELAEVLQAGSSEGKVKAGAKTARAMTLYCISAFVRIQGQPVPVTAAELDDVASGSPAARLAADAVAHYSAAVSGEEAGKSSPPAPDGER